MRDARVLLIGLRSVGWTTVVVHWSCVCILPLAHEKLTFTNLDDIPPSKSLADGFKISLVQPPGEPADSGSKALVQSSSIHLLEEAEWQALDAYDAVFEKYSMFCNGRWLGAQILQDSQDLMYLQHVVYMKKPDIIIETGTYKGGLTYFFASLLDWIDREEESRKSHGGFRRDTKVLSVDRHHPDLVFEANWFCPVCADCIRPYTTAVWDRKVRFLQGLADGDEVYVNVLENLIDLGYLKATGEKYYDLPELVMDTSKTLVVNLDANHEFPGLVRELFFYALLVSENSYLVVQDVKLDKIWGTAGPTAAVEHFLGQLPPGEFVVEPELKFHGYSQHVYLRRAQVTVRHTYFLDKAREMEQIFAKQKSGG